MNEELNYRKWKLHYGWIILILSVTVVTAALGLARFGYTMILPAMKEGLSLSETQAGDLATGNMIGYMALALTCGIIASRFGPKIVIIIFMLITCASMFLTALASDYFTALAGRILTGMGSAGANVSIMGIIAAWFASKKRGMASGIAVSGSSFGLLVTGIIIPVILSNFKSFGWRLSWIILAIITFLICVLCSIFLKASPKEKGLLPIGSETGKQNIRNEKISSLKWSLIYKTPGIWYIAFVYVLFGFSYIIYATFFSRYLTGEAGFTTEAAGGLWSLVGAFSILSGLLWGKVSDHLGRNYGLAIVYFLQFLSFIIFGLWKADIGYYLSAFFFALTAWSIPAIMAASCGDILGAKLAPAGVGFITLFFGIGQAAGPFVAGRLASITSSYKTAFIIAGIAALTGSIASLFIKSSRKEYKTNDY